MSSWDVFSQVPWLSDHEQNEIFYAKCRKVFKIFTYIFLFTGIFVTAFLSKGALLMAVSNLRPPPARATTTATQPAGSNVTDFYQYHTLECLNFTDTYNVSIRFLNLTMSETVVDNRTMCVAVPVGYSKQVDCLELRSSLVTWLPTQRCNIRRSNATVFVCIGSGLCSSWSACLTPLWSSALSGRSCSRTKTRPEWPPSRGPSSPKHCTPLASVSSYSTFCPPWKTHSTVSCSSPASQSFRVFYWWSPVHQTSPNPARSRWF